MRVLGVSSPMGQALSRGPQRLWGTHPAGVVTRAFPLSGPSTLPSALQENFPNVIKGRSDKYLWQTVHLLVKGLSTFSEIGKEMRTPILAMSG